MYFITDALEIKRKSFIIISCGILITCSSVSLLNATYLHDVDSYSLSLLFVSIGLWISKKIKKGYLFAIPFYIVSLGLYQAYIQIAVFVYVIMFVIKILNGKELKETFIQLIKDAIAIIISMILYYAIYRILLIIFDVSEGNMYNSVSQATNLVNISLKDRLYNTIVSELNWFIYPNSNKQTFVFIINIILLIAAFVSIIITIIKNKIKIMNVIIVTLVILFAPFAVNIITFLSNQSHALTLFPLSFFYIFVIVLLQNVYDVYEYKKIVVICITALSLMIADNCIFSNRIYLQKELINQNTLSIMTRIIDRIEQEEGYEVGKTKVAIIGRLGNSSLVYKKKHSIDYKGATGMFTNFVTTSYSTYQNYFNNYLGYPINLLDEEKSNEYKENEEVKKMKSFPSIDSCKLIDDVMVIKLSD